MSLLDEFDDDQIDDTNFVEIQPASLNVCFVFKKDLKDNQILSLIRCFPDVVSQDSYSGSFKRFFLCIKDYEDWTFLKTIIPRDLADQLSYMECYIFKGESPIMFFKSNVLLSREILIRKVRFEIRMRKSLDKGVEVSLSDIIDPVWLGYWKRGYHKVTMDIVTAEMIASHFFFNPNVVLPIKRAGIVESLVKKETILDAYKTAKKVIVIDESQKVKMYKTTPNAEKPSEISDIELWLKDSSTHDIIVRSGNDETEQHIYIVVHEDEKSVIPQSYILAFI